jgi:hypothetical protein
MNPQPDYQDLTPAEHAMLDAWDRRDRIHRLLFNTLGVSTTLILIAVVVWVVLQ